LEDIIRLGEREREREREREEEEEEDEAKKVVPGREPIGTFKLPGDLVIVPL